jgi:putative phosphonate metabolism protein
MSAARYAIYYAPPFDGALWREANRWLGRDPIADAPLMRPALPALDGLDLDALTDGPRHYGFHATLKAPFELASHATERDLLAAAEAFASGRKTFAIALAPAALGPFLVFRETAPSADLQQLADDCVRDFDGLRAPLSEADIARRRRAKLSQEQDAQMLRWGYPYVFADFRFHMTLTGTIRDDATRARVLGALTAHFGPLSGPHAIDAIAVFAQATREAPFTALARFSFRG